jgi:hypothetical protein
LEISKYLSLFFDKAKRIFSQPKYKLNFLPFWVFEYHCGLDVGFGSLDGISSKLNLNENYIKEILTTKKIVSLEELLKNQKFDLIDEKIIETKITEKEEAEKIINYKIPLILKNENLLITKLNQIYIPFWEVNTTLDEKKYRILINALNECDIELKLEEFVNKLVPKEKSNTSAFYDTAQGFFSIKQFFFNFLDVFETFFKFIFFLLKQLFKKNSLFIIALIVIIIILIMYLI